MCFGQQLALEPPPRVQNVIMRRRIILPIDDLNSIGDDIPIDLIELIREWNSLGLCCHLTYFWNGEVNVFAHCSSTTCDRYLPN